MSAAFDPATLRGIVQRFAGRRVAVLGDCMLDHYLWGRVDRISPEAPVPVVEIERESFGLGGAGNVAANLKAVGADRESRDEVAGLPLEQLLEALERELPRCQALVVSDYGKGVVHPRVLAG